MFLYCFVWLCVCILDFCVISKRLIRGASGKLQADGKIEKNSHWSWECALVAEHLLSIHKAESWKTKELNTGYTRRETLAVKWK